MVIRTAFKGSQLGNLLLVSNVALLISVLSIRCAHEHCMSNTITKSMVKYFVCKPDEMQVVKLQSQVYLTIARSALLSQFLDVLNGSLSTTRILKYKSWCCSRKACIVYYEEQQNTILY